ncbi:GyrI-like domain-containing protein [Streptomyces sp. H28]|uniref:GyrI-like domain-containing protein n=1 Tax=Streptomyces sp. H28 TaxID=2775865 RepID=UPI001CE19EB8|nr:GyrI-like domain-containing protein [Streptomyces sp. H28]
MIRSTAHSQEGPTAYREAGSYDDETPVLTRLHGAYLPAHGLRETGVHHEIYLSDPRRTRPDRLRTFLRQPVASGPASR